MVGFRWKPGIGDPTPVGWLTVLAYAVAAVLSWRAFAAARLAQRSVRGVDDAQAGDQRSMKLLWLFIGLSMILLGLNKQLDLQTLVIQRIRRRAYVEGWYGDRRRYQMDFILAMTVAGVIAVTALSVWLRRVLQRVFVAIAGLGLLLSFLLIRAASFHYVDKLLSLGGRVRLNSVIELSGIGLIALAAGHFHATESRDLDRLSELGPSAPQLSLPPTSRA